MESIEEIIGSKLFPALFEMKEGDSLCFTTKDVAYAIAKTKEQLQFYDFNSGAYSTKLQSEESMKAFVLDDFGGFKIDRTIYPNRMIGVNDVTADVLISTEKKRVFLKNLFNLDKIVEEICPNNYAIARSVVSNFIYQNEKTPDGRTFVRKNDLLTLAAYDSLKKPILNETHNVENAIFFIDTLSVRNYTSFVMDLKSGEFNEPMSLPTSKNVFAWVMHSFLKTGDAELAMKKMQSCIIKDCSAKPMQIYEYLKVIPSRNVGLMANDGELMIYLCNILGENVMNPEIKDVVDKLSPMFLVTKSLKKYHDMMFSLMNENNMFFNLNDSQKKEMFTTMVEVIFQSFDINGALTFSKVNCLSLLHESAKKLSFDFDNCYSPENINYILRNLKVDSEVNSDVAIINALKNQTPDELGKSLADVYMENTLGKEFVQKLYALSYAQEKSPSEENPDFYKALKDSFMQQLDSELTFSINFSKSNIVEKEDGLLNKLQNFPNWVSEQQIFYILLSSVAYNSAFNSKVRDYFAEKYPEDYRNVLYTFQDFREEISNKKSSTFEESPDAFKLLWKKSVNFSWKGESKLFNVPVFSSGVKDEEINKFRMQDTINVTVSKNKGSNDSDDFIPETSFKL